MIVVERAAPLLTVQDRGRFGLLADGITRSGPLDSLAFAVANVLAGNDMGAAAFEACLGGARFRCERDLTFAIAGAAEVVTLEDLPLAPYVAHTARAGSVITVEHSQRGAVWYLAVRGGLATPVILGSRATLLSAELGGRAIRNGARFACGAAPAGSPVIRAVPSELRVILPQTPLLLCEAPRSEALDTAQWRDFFATPFKVTHAVSRVGYRLEGRQLRHQLPADLASEPACAGAMQLPPEGQPIVLMADHPTIGGYPIIGVVARYALGRLAQCLPGTVVTFTPGSAEAAREAHARELNTLSKWASGE